MAKLKKKKREKTGNSSFELPKGEGKKKATFITIWCLTGSTFAPSDRILRNKYLILTAVSSVVRLYLPSHPTRTTISLNVDRTAHWTHT